MPTRITKDDLQNAAGGGMVLFRARSVRGEARRRGIRLLLHSTHLYRNLPHILADGCLETARGLRVRHGKAASRFLHDPCRYEQLHAGLDYLNASLAFPNVELLYHRSRAGWKAEWVHLSLDLALLTRADTLFCPVSAASQRGRFLQCGVAGLRAMFADVVEGHTRQLHPRDVPTHPQAEVLVRGPLDLGHVKEVLVQDAGTAQEVERLCRYYGRSLSVRVAPQLFVWPAWLLPERP